MIQEKLKLLVTLPPMDNFRQETKYGARTILLYGDIGRRILGCWPRHHSNRAPTYSNVCAIGDYGKGVAWVIVVPAVVSAEHRTHFDREHAYEPGTRTVNADGLEYDVRDVLKIFIFPNPSIMRAANSVGDVVECVKAALLSEEPALVALDIPNFDMRRFLSDFIVELENIVESPDLLASPRRLRNFRSCADGWAERATTSRHRLSGCGACVCRGRTARVYAAAKRKDRKALMPLMNRMNEFIEPWADEMKGKGKKGVDL